MWRRWRRSLQSLRGVMLLILLPSTFRQLHIERATARTRSGRLPPSRTVNEYLKLYVRGCARHRVSYILVDLTISLCEFETIRLHHIAVLS